MILCLQTVSNVIAVGTSHGLALVFGKRFSPLCCCGKVDKGHYSVIYLTVLEGMFICLIITV